MMDRRRLLRHPTPSLSSGTTERSTSPSTASMTDSGLGSSTVVVPLTTGTPPLIDLEDDDDGASTIHPSYSHYPSHAHTFSRPTPARAPLARDSGAGLSTADKLKALIRKMETDVREATAEPPNSSTSLHPTSAPQALAPIPSSTSRSRSSAHVPRDVYRRSTPSPPPPPAVHRSDEEDSPPTPPPRITNPYLHARRQQETVSSLGRASSRTPSRAVALQAAAAAAAEVGPSRSRSPSPPRGQRETSPLETYIANQPAPPTQSPVRRQAPRSRTPSSPEPSSSRVRIPSGEHSRKGKERALDYAYEQSQQTEMYTATEEPTPPRRRAAARRHSIDRPPDTSASFAAGLEEMPDMELDIDDNSSVPWESESEASAPGYRSRLPPAERNSRENRRSTASRDASAYTESRSYSRNGRGSGGSSFASPSFATAPSMSQSQFHSRSHSPSSARTIQPHSPSSARTIRAPSPSSARTIRPPSPDAEMSLPAIPEPESSDEEESSALRRRRDLFRPSAELSRRSRSQTPERSERELSEHERSAREPSDRYELHRSDGETYDPNDVRDLVQRSRSRRENSERRSLEESERREQRELEQSERHKRERDDAAYDALEARDSIQRSRSRREHSASLPDARQRQHERERDFTDTTSRYDIRDDTRDGPSTTPKSTRTFRDSGRMEEASVKSITDSQVRSRVREGDAERLERLTTSSDLRESTHARERERDLGREHRPGSGRSYERTYERSMTRERSASETEDVSGLEVDELRKETRETREITLSHRGSRTSLREAAREASVRDASLRDASLRDPSLRGTSPRDSPPREPLVRESSRELSLRGSSSQDDTPEGTFREVSLRGSSPHNETPEGTFVEHSTPRSDDDWSTRRRRSTSSRDSRDEPPPLKRGSSSPDDTPEGTFVERSSLRSDDDRPTRQRWSTSSRDSRDELPPLTSRSSYESESSWREIRSFGTPGGQGRGSDRVSTSPRESPPRPLPAVDESDTLPRTPLPPKDRSSPPSHLRRLVQTVDSTPTTSSTPIREPRSALRRSHAPTPSIRSSVRWSSEVEIRSIERESTTPPSTPPQLKPATPNRSAQQPTTPAPAPGHFLQFGDSRDDPNPPSDEQTTAPSHDEMSEPATPARVAPEPATPDGHALPSSFATPRVSGGAWRTPLREPFATPSDMHDETSTTEVPETHAPATDQQWTPNGQSTPNRPSTQFGGFTPRMPGWHQSMRTPRFSSLRNEVRPDDSMSSTGTGATEESVSVHRLRTSPRKKAIVGGQPGPKTPSPRRGRHTRNASVSAQGAAGSALFMSTFGGGTSPPSTPTQRDHDAADPDESFTSTLSAPADADTSWTARIKNAVLSPLRSSRSKSLTEAEAKLAEASAAREAARLRVEAAQRAWLDALASTPAEAPEPTLPPPPPPPAPVVVVAPKRRWGWGVWAACALLELVLLWGVFRVTLEYATSAHWLSSIDPRYSAPHAIGRASSRALDAWVVQHRTPENLFDLLESLGLGFGRQRGWVRPS